MKKENKYILRVFLVVGCVLLAAWNNNIAAIAGWLVASVYVICDTPNED